MRIATTHLRASTPLAVTVAACLLLAAASLLIPSVPTYGDPWVWIIWGREVLDGELNTVSGPSWKPLPVLLLTPLSLLGDAVDEAWLVIARAGFAGALALVYVLAARMAGRVAGVLSAGLLAMTPFVLDNALRGYSEGLCALGVLGALHRHRAGRHGQAFALLFAAALLRPEAWPFLGLYGLWLLWRAPRRLPWLAAAAVLLGALWLLPEQWGSGDFWRASERAQDVGSHSPSLAAVPALEVAKLAAGMLNAPGCLAVAAAVGFPLLRRVDRGARADALSLAAVAGVWTALVALMTELGYSGNERYLIVPMTLAFALIGPGVVWSARALAQRLPRLQLRRAPGWAAMALAVLCVAAYGARGLPGQLRTYAYEVAAVRDFERAAARAGGVERLRACGDVDTHPLYRGYVAWELRLPMARVGDASRGSAAVLRTRFRAEEAVEPAPLAGAESLRTSRWQVQLACQLASAPVTGVAGRG